MFGDILSLGVGYSMSKVRTFLELKFCYSQPIISKYFLMLMLGLIHVKGQNGNRARFCALKSPLLLFPLVRSVFNLICLRKSHIKLSVNTIECKLNLLLIYFTVDVLISHPKTLDQFPIFRMQKTYLANDPCFVPVH